MTQEPRPERPTGPTGASGRTDQRPASWGAIGVYCLIAFGLAWLVCLPLWLGDGLTSPAFVVCSVAMMFTPTVAAVIVVRFIEKRPAVGALGLRPWVSARRTVVFLALAIVVICVLVVLGLVTSAWFGTFQFDLIGMSAFRELSEAQLAAAGQDLDATGMPLRLLWALQFVNVGAGALINTVPAAGEEIGWRGYLYPRLLELMGPAGAVLASGVIWGLWHAPLILLGYNYPTHPVLGVFAMCVPTIGLGAVLAWLSQRGGSVWPAALGHGAYNAAMGSFIVLFADADFEVDAFSGSLMGWGGWPIWLVVVGVLLAVAGCVPSPRAPDLLSDARTRPPRRR